MGSAKTFLWRVLLLMVMVTFLEHQSLAENTSVPRSFRAKFYHRGYFSQLPPTLDHFQAMINHSINRMHYFGNALRDEPTSPILSGYMDYIIEVDIGTPPKTFYLIMDTGSPITWVQSQDCVTCINNEGPRLDYKNSPSAEEILCHEDACDEGDDIKCNYDTYKCSYFIPYMDESNSSGIMLLEKFTFFSIDGAKIILENVRLGAAFDCKGSFHNDTDGMFGLSRDRRSFINQNEFNSFSYCIPSDREWAAKVGAVSVGNIIFGTETLPVGNSTAMVPNQEFYVISLNGISVNGTLLDIDRSVFRDKNGQGCTLIDTGTPISRMPRAAYQEVARILRSVIRLPTFVIRPDMLCYEYGSEDIDQYIPDITLHFEGLDLPIVPRSLFFKIDDTICLAMIPVENAEDSILGASFQQNINIFFDIEDEKIFMHPMTCDNQMI